MRKARDFLEDNYAPHGFNVGFNLGETAEDLLRAAHRASLKRIGGALNTIVHHSYLRWLHTRGLQ